MPRRFRPCCSSSSPFWRSSSIRPGGARPTETQYECRTPLASPLPCLDGSLLGPADGGAVLLDGHQLVQVQPGGGLVPTDVVADGMAFRERSGGARFPRHLSDNEFGDL